MIYSKFIKRKKLKYFLNYKANTISKTKSKSKSKNKKRNTLLKKIDVHDRLFNDSILKQEMLDNLLNKYLLNEEEKYTFYPKINQKNINYYTKIPYLYKNPNISIILSDRNKSSKSFNKNYNIDNFPSSNFNKYSIYAKMNKRNGGNSTRSLSCSNLNLSYLDSLYRDFNNNYRNYSFYQKIEDNKNTSIPITTKYKNKLYNNFFNDDLKDSYNNRLDLNKTSMSLYQTISNGKNNNNKNKKSGIPFNYNNNYQSNCQKITNGAKKKKIKKNNSQQIENIEKNNKKLFEKKLKHTNDYSVNEDSNFCNYYKISSNNELIKDLNSYNKNNNSSLYNISSIACSIKKGNTINKSPESKEHLFSFGSDLLFIDNNNSNIPKSLINKSLIEKLQKKNIKNKNIRKNNLINNKVLKRNNNSIIKTNNKIINSKSNINSLTGINHISTNYSGNISSSKLNKNINGDIIKINNNNGKDKDNNNQLAVQSTNEYYLIKDKNELIFQTTIQTLSDSKILDLANDYISEDDSLESYRKKSVIYSKKHLDNEMKNKL